MTVIATQVRAITFNGETVHACPMSAVELDVLAEDIELLSLPEVDWTGFNALRGWTLWSKGSDIGRVFSRGTVMTAEWFDNIEQHDWVLAKWGCRRLENGVREILRMRDQVTYSVAA